MPNIDDLFERTIRLDERVSTIDKKIDRLIAAVPTAPTPADQKPPSDDAAEPSGDRLPKNPSELAGFSINKLGKLGTPFLIIAIVIGAYLGIQEVFSTINQRDESVRKTFTETAVATLKVGESVVKNTEKLIELNAKLGDTGEKLLDLQRKAAAEAEKAVTEKLNAERAVQKAEEESKKAVQATQKADDLRKNLTDQETLLKKAHEKVKARDGQLSVLRANLTQEEKKLKQAKADLETKRTALAMERGEIELAQANVAAREELLRDKDAELSETQSTITSLKEDLKRLRDKGQNQQARFRKELTGLRAKSITLVAAETSSQFRIAALEGQNEDLIDSLKSARTIIRNFGDPSALVPEIPELTVPAPRPVEPIRPSQIKVVAEILRRYANTPDAVTFDEWRRIDDEDVTSADLDSLLKTDLGYELVVKAKFTDSYVGVEEVNVMYFLIRRTTSDQVNGIVVLNIKEDGTGWSVDNSVSSLTFVRVRDLTDFNRTQVATILDNSNFGEPNDIETLFKFQSEMNALTFSDFLETFFGSERDLEVTSIDVHFGGPEKAVRILGMAGAGAKFPDLVKRWTTEDNSIAVGREMENRAISFDADNLIPAEPFGAEPALRAALVRLIGAAVSENTPVASPLMTKPLTVEDLGRLAAIALRGELVFDKSPYIQIAQTKTAAGTATDPPTVPAASATVFASIHQPKLRPMIEGVEFRLRRESGNPQWKLIGFGAAAKRQK